jgi:hypothetical protein
MKHNNRPLGWEPARTWAFVVGTLEWKHADYFGPFPKENRRDAALVECFRALGVPPAQIVYLQDREATTKRIERELDAQLAAARPGDTLLLYYCGHGAKTDDGAAYFASYDADGDANGGWVMDSVPAAIQRRFGGSRALLLADCCYSGVLAEAVARHTGRVALACLASSLSSELSTGNWTFTEGLLAGFGGHALVDADGDQAITLRELAAQVAESMAFAEEQIAAFHAAPGFDADLVIGPARPRPDPRVGRSVGVSSKEGWYRAQVVDARGDQLKVHYYGYEASDDEWVAPERIREIARPTYPIGASVSVRWKRKWYPATVRDVRAGIHYIEYEGFGPEWNEWVALSRIQPIA